MTRQTLTLAQGNPAAPREHGGDGPGSQHHGAIRYPVLHGGRDRGANQNPHVQNQGTSPHRPQIKRRLLLEASPHRPTMTTLVAALPAHIRVRSHLTHSIKVHLISALYAVEAHVLPHGCATPGYGCRGGGRASHSHSLTTADAARPCRRST